MSREWLSQRKFALFFGKNGDFSGLRRSALHPKVSRGSLPVSRKRLRHGQICVVGKKNGVFFSGFRPFHFPCKKGFFGLRPWKLPFFSVELGTQQQEGKISAFFAQRSKVIGKLLKKPTLLDFVLKIAEDF